MVKSKSQKFAKGKSKKDTWKKLKHHDLDEFLQEQRDDERLGLAGKSNDELFVIDQEGTDAFSRAARPSQTKTRASARKTKDKNGPLVDFDSLRCFQILKSDSAVKDPVIKRNRVRLPGGNKSASMKLKDTLRQSKKNEKKTQNLSPEDSIIDPWSAPEAKKVAGVLSNEWFSDETKRNLVRNRSVHKVKKPSTQLKAVEAPHPGLSINPSFKDHQAILKELVDITKSEIRKEQKLIRATAIPKDAVIKDDDDMKEEMEIKSEPESDSDDDSKTGILRSKPKTRQQKRKMRELNEQQRTAQEEKDKSKREAEVFRIKSLKKDIVKMETEAKKKLDRKVEKKLIHQKYGQLKLGKHKYKPLKPDPLLSNEIGGSFMSDAQNSIAGLTLERFNSLQKRNLIEPTVKQSMKRKYKLKKYQRRSEKMEWEVTGMWNGEKLLVPGNQRRQPASKRRH